MKSLVLAVFGLCAAVLCAAPFRDGDTVVFLGDSITHGGRYHQFVTDFYRTRFPDAKIRFVNSGIGGDSASGAQRRLKEDVAEYDPTVVAIHFGMNDIDREAYTAETSPGLLRRRADAQERYRQNLSDLVGKVKAAAPGASLVYLTPTAYDDTAQPTNIPPGATGWATVNQIGCNEGLAQMAGHVLAKAKADGAFAVDWFSPLSNFLDRHRRTDPHFMVTAWDRVHPNDVGHSVMAWKFLEAQGVSPIVSDVAVDARSGAVARSENAAVSDVVAKDGSLSFAILEKSLPMPVAPAALKFVVECKVAERLNREMLSVTGLSDGWHILLVDGKEIGVWTAEDFAAGINLAFNDRTPQYAQAQAVMKRDSELRGRESAMRNHHSARWYFGNKTDVDDLAALKAYVDALPDKGGYFGKFVPGYIEYWPTYRETRAKLLAAQNEVYELAKPVAHRYEVRPVARVEICPQMFDAGGWKLDVQFMDVMGSPYLLAHGAGIRVTDAKASVEVPEGGAWRVWARSRKWVDGAGAFNIEVGGRRLERTFGVSQSGWDWEDGGEIQLDKGRVEVRLVDGDGFDGRCAGVVLTKGGGRPGGALSPRGAAPDEEREFDFVVVGGGMPGTCAAVAAARRGLKVVLVQDRPVLGGNASAEIRVWSAGEAKYPLVRELRGWFMNRDAEMSLSDAHRMRVVEDEKGLSVFLRHRVFAADASGGEIASVTALDWGRNRVVRFKAPLFCDATGDGWLGFYAGAEWRMGREAKDEFGETFAPDKADSHTLGASLMWKSASANTDIPFSAPWAEPHAQGVEAVRGEWNWEYGIRRDMIAEGEAIRDRLLLAVYGAFSLAKKKEVNSRLVIDTLPFLLGKRESRRLVGDWVYSEKDVTEKHQFEDAIAAGSWSVDLHYDDARAGVDFLTTCRQPHYGRYWIPYRSIYSRNIRNLFMAGRCFSCTHVGLGGPRVINTLSQLGCAAGEAAAICCERSILPRDVWKNGLVQELQDRLGGKFPGRPDPALVGWSVVDDETSGVVLGDGWEFNHFANGEQVGDGAHCPSGNSGWGVNVKKGVKCGDAVYPLPVAAKGRYALMGRCPYLHNANVDSETIMEITSGGRAVRFTVNQAVGMGAWRQIGEFDLESGATLRIIPSESHGVVIADGFALVRK